MGYNNVWNFLFSSRFLSDFFLLKMHAIIFTINHQWWQFSVHAPHVLSSRGCHKICIDQAVNTKTSHYAMYYIYIMYTLLTPLTDPIITTSFSYCTPANFPCANFVFRILTLWLEFIMTKIIRETSTRSCIHRYLTSDLIICNYY